MRFLFLALFCTLFLFAQSDQELLKRAQNYAKSSSKTDQVRAYNDFKNLYLRAMIESNDVALKKAALEGIIKSGTSLKIDVAHYKNELKKEQEKKVAPKKLVSQKPAPQKVATQEKRVPKKEEAKKVAPPKKNLSTTASKTQVMQAQNETTKKSQKVQITSSHKLKSIRWQEGRLLLNFDKALQKNQINHFTLHEPKKNRYRYIFDIHASMLTQAQNLKKNGIDKIKIAQFNQEKLRLVIDNSKKVDISFKVDGDSLVVHIVSDAKSQVIQTTPRALPAKYSQVKRKPVDRHKVIVIDPGHGGKDPGAVGYKKYREKVVVLDISKKLKSILESRGYRVYLTRDRDRFLTLRERSIYANKRHADLFVSIHANAVEKKNAHKAYGIECYFLDKSRSQRAKNVAAKENSADLSGLNFYAKESFLNTLSSHNIIASNKLAIDLQGNMLKILRKSYRDVKDGGVRPAPFWVLVGAQMPAVLVEVGFISHSMEAQRLVNRNYQEKLALGLANGIENYFINN